MPSEGIRSRYAGTTGATDNRFQITVRGRTVRIHLVGILDREGTTRLIQLVTRALPAGRCLVVLDARALTHLDYRCVGMLVRWSRGLQSLGHRLLLERWSRYLRAILAMEDWDGELERGTLGPGWKPMESQLAHVQAP